jgi:hypothetical protein
VSLCCLAPAIERERSQRSYKLVSGLLSAPTSSASTAASQPTPATFPDGFSAPRAQQQPLAQGPHTYVQRLFVPRRRYFQ